MPRKKRKLRLYVWEDVLTDYTSGVMFALAESVEEARALIRENCVSSPTLEADLKLEPDVYEPTGTPVGFAVWGGS